MYKLMILFKKPKCPEEFNQYYYDELMPLVKTIDGLERMELLMIREPLGNVRNKNKPRPFDLQIEMYFLTKKHFQYFLNESQSGEEFQEMLSAYSDAIYTFAWGQTETISKSEIVARYNDYLIRSSTS